MYASIINLTYLCEIKYNINITFHFLYFHWSLCLQALCANIIINIWIKPALCTPYYKLKMNVIQSDEYTYFWLILINYDLSNKSVSKEY